MKKILLAAAIIVLGSTATTFAQNTAQSNLNVNVSNTKSISVASGSNININLNTPAAFTAAAGTTGVDGNMNTVLNVVSNGGYKVTVTTQNGADLVNGQGTNGITTIPANKIYLTVSSPTQIVSGSDAPNATFVSAPTNLINSTSAGNVLIGTPQGASNGQAGTSGTSYNVNYTLANFAQVASLATGAFGATVIYTIADN